jgi:hypothetical protein
MYSGEEKDESVQALMDVNGLRYAMTAGVSVSTSRIVREWDAQRATYTGGEVVQFIIGSGAAFVDPKNSYLKFTIQIAGTDANSRKYRFFWGNDRKGRQNAMQLFSDFRMTHSSGYEIDRLQSRLGTWAVYRDSYGKSLEWWQTVGSLLRGCQTDDAQFGNDGSGGALVYSNPQETNASYVDADNTQGSLVFNERKPFVPVDSGAGSVINIDVEIPLSCIAGIWDNDQLAPPYLMAGLSLQMTLNLKELIWTLRTTDADPATITSADWAYQIVNPRLALETITFTDAVLRALSLTSVANGLEMPFMATHYLQSTAFNSNNSIQINRGLSRANLIVIRNYQAAQVAINSNTLLLDSNAASYIPTGANNGFQVKLGSEFMPNRPLDQALSLYHAAQTAFGNWRADQQNTVTIEDYCGRGPNNVGNVPNPFSVLGLMAMTLEKSSTLAQSGSPISASRDLQAVFGSAFPTNGNNIDVFVPYVSMASLFADAVLVRS